MNSTLFVPTIQHKWTIHNFGHLLTVHSLSTLHSTCFPPKCNEFQFSLRLLPNYVLQDNSFVSIFLHLEDCAEKVSLKTRYRITLADQDHTKEGLSTFVKGNCHGFATFVPVNTLNKMLNQFNNNLNVICQVEIENHQKISSLKVLYPHSSSVFNVVQKTSKLSCKWILDDFSLFYYENWNRDKVSLRLKNFSVPENEDLSFYLVLVLSKDDKHLIGSNCKKSISLFLYFESNNVKKVMVHNRMSILNWKGKPYVTGEGHGKMHSKGDGRGATNFISCDELMDLRRGLLPKDMLIIIAQIETFEPESKGPQLDIFKHFTQLWSKRMRLGKGTLTKWGKSSEPQTVKKQVYFKLQHTFVIYNYGYFYIDDHHSPTMTQSCPFPLNQGNVQFCLRLHPNCANSEAENPNYISTFVHLLTGPDVHVECKLSIIDFRYKVCNTKSIKGLLTKDNQLGFDDFITNDCTVLHRHGYLPGKLAVLCEIEILDCSANHEDLFSHVSTSSGLTNEPSIEKSMSSWDASEYVLKHEHQWTIPQYKFIHQHNICASSDSFAIENLDSLQFCLKLMPKGQTKMDSYLSLLMNLSDGEIGQVKVLSRLSIRDYQNKLRDSKWIYGMLIGQKGIACDRYIENDYLFEQENELLPENNLTINCEIEVLRKLKDELTDSIAQMGSQVTSNHLVMDSIQSMNVTNSIVIFDSRCTFDGNISLSYND